MSDDLFRRELPGAALTVPRWRALTQVTPAQARALDEITLSARLPRRSPVTHVWTRAARGAMQNVGITNMPAHSARRLECMDA